MKIMVTGSRDFDKVEVVERVLRRYEKYDPVLLVGDCPTGADKIATMYAARNGWSIHVFAADWTKFGRAAGPIRNGEIVKAGPDICVGFVRNESRGTLNAMKQARDAGVPIYRYEYGE